MDEPATQAPLSGTSTIQVRLTTRTETPISSTPIVIPTNVTRYTLSQILNHLLENPTPIPYSFLINSVYLPSSLDEYITSHGLSREEVLEIEYVRSVLPPQWEASWTQDDWINGVSVVNENVVTASYDGIVRIWDWSGNVNAKANAGEGALRPLKWIKWIDGGFVSGSMDGSLRVWDYQDGKISTRLEGRGHEASVDAGDYRDGKVISAGADSTLRLWSANPEGGEDAESVNVRKRRRTDAVVRYKAPLATFTSPNGQPLTSTTFHPVESSVAYSTSLSSNLYTHDLMHRSLEPISSSSFSAPLLSMASLSSLSLLALGTTTNKIIIHDPRSDTISQHVLSGHEGFISALSSSPENSHMFASGSYDGHVRVWDVRNPSGSIFKLSRDAKAGKILALDWHEKGLISGGQDGKLDIWRGNGGNMSKL